MQENDAHADTMQRILHQICNIELIFGSIKDFSGLHEQFDQERNVLLLLQGLETNLKTYNELLKVYLPFVK